MIPETWVLALFKKFQARYGHKWVMSLEGIEDFAAKEWMEVLAGLSGEQIKFGLDNLDDEWPPSAPGFRALCLGKKVNGLGLDYTPPYHTEYRPERLLESDEEKDRNKKAAEAGLSQIKKTLGI